MLTNISLKKVTKLSDDQFAALAAKTVVENKLQKQANLPVDDPPAGAYQANLADIFESVNNLKDFNLSLGDINKTVSPLVDAVKKFPDNKDLIGDITEETRAKLLSKMKPYPYGPVHQSIKHFMENRPVRAIYDLDVVGLKNLNPFSRYSSFVWPLLSLAGYAGGRYLQNRFFGDSIERFMSGKKPKKPGLFSSLMAEVEENINNPAYKPNLPTKKQIKEHVRNLLSEAKDIHDKFGIIETGSRDSPKLSDTSKQILHRLVGASTPVPSQIRQSLIGSISKALQTQSLGSSALYSQAPSRKHQSLRPFDLNQFNLRSWAELENVLGSISDKQAPSGVLPSVGGFLGKNLFGTIGALLPLVAREWMFGGYRSGEPDVDRLLEGIVRANAYNPVINKRP